MPKAALPRRESAQCVVVVCINRLEEGTKCDSEIQRECKGFVAGILDPKHCIECAHLEMCHAKG